MTELFTYDVNILLQKYNKAIKFHQETKTNNKDKHNRSQSTKFQVKPYRNIFQIPKHKLTLVLTHNFKH